MTQREEFENWYVKVYHVDGLINRKDGCYMHLPAGMAWDAWQAAQAPQPVQPNQAVAVEPLGYVVEHNVLPQSSGKWSFHPASQGLSFYKDTALVITPVYTTPPDTEAKDAALRAALWDAKRYRYLRDNCVIQNRASTDGPAYKELRFHGKIYPDWRFAIDHLGLDAAVDAAIAQIEALDIAAINAKETK